jgi:non-heme chloroperoxidase
MHTFSKRSAVALIAAFLVPFAIAGPAQEQKFEAVPVKTTDGLTISAQDWGNPDGLEILFIQGSSQGHLSWIKQMRSE